MFRRKYGIRWIDFSVSFKDDLSPNVGYECLYFSLSLCLPSLFFDLILSVLSPCRFLFNLTLSIPVFQSALGNLYTDSALSLSHFVVLVCIILCVCVLFYSHVFFPSVFPLTLPVVPVCGHSFLDPLLFSVCFLYFADCLLDFCVPPAFYFPNFLSTFITCVFFDCLSLSLRVSRV